MFTLSFSHNHPYLHLPKYLPSLLNHPVFHARDSARWKGFTILILVTIYIYIYAGSSTPAADGCRSLLFGHFIYYWPMSSYTSLGTIWLLQHSCYCCTEITATVFCCRYAAVCVHSCVQPGRDQSVVSPGLPTLPQ